MNDPASALSNSPNGIAGRRSLKRSQSHDLRLRSTGYPCGFTRARRKIHLRTTWSRPTGNCCSGNCSRIFVRSTKYCESQLKPIWKGASQAQNWSNSTKPARQRAFTKFLSVRRARTSFHSNPSPSIWSLLRSNLLLSKSRKLRRRPRRNERATGSEWSFVAGTAPRCILGQPARDCAGIPGAHTKGTAPFSEPMVVKQPKFTRVEEPTWLCNHVEVRVDHSPPRAI